jgi:ATP/maltotriose-dependent transcriptional regulator MalT
VPSDRDATTLVEALVNSFSSDSKEPDTPDIRTQRSAPAVSSASSVTAIVELANRLSWSHVFQTIIVDDLNSIVGSDSALKQIRHLIRFTPDHVRFILITRHWASDLLADAVDRDPAVMAANDLVFSLRELEDGLAETELPWIWWKAAQRLHNEFAGWPLAVGTVLHSAKAESDPNLDDLMIAVQRLASGMVHETVMDLSPADAEVLRVAVNLQYFDESIVNQLATSGNCPSDLASLMRSGIVQSSSVEGSYFCICPAYRQASLLDGNCAELSKEQHSAAADWYELIGDKRCSYRHRICMGDETAANKYLGEFRNQMENPDECREYVRIFDSYYAKRTSMPDQELVMARGYAALRLGVVSENAAYLAKLVERAESLGETTTVFRVKYAIALRNLGRYDASYAEASACLSDSAVDAATQCKVLRLLGTLKATALAFSDADMYFERALATTVDASKLQYSIMSDLAQYRWIQGRLEDCKRICDEVLSIADSHLYYQAMAMARNGLGIYWQSKGEYGLAERCLGDALAILRIPLYRAIEALLWLSLADLSFDQNALDEAERRYRRALAISTIVDQPSYVSYALSGLAGVERLRGRFAEAGKLLADARECIGPEQRYDIAVCSLRKAHLLMDENKLGLALHELDDTIVALRDGGALIDLSRGLLLRANTLFLGYGLEAAQPDLTELMGCIETIGTSHFLAPYCRRMPRLLRSLAASPQLKGYASILALDAKVPTARVNGKVTPIARVDDPHPNLLNDRELEVVRGLCEGLSRTELAARVGRSRSTVDKLIHTIYTATGFEATHQIVAWAYRVGLYRPPVRHD